MGWNEIAERFSGLDCSGAGVLSLEGIEALPALELLDMARNPGLGGLEHIADLPLRYLFLGEADIDQEGVEIIGSIVTLEELELAGNDLGNVSALSSLVNMRRLLLSGAGITAGVAQLSTLTNATTISLTGNPNSPCEDLASLQESLPNASISPVSPEVGRDCR